MRAFSYLLHSNVWIAFGAPSLIGITCYEKGLSYPFHLGIGAFFFVLLSYSLQRWMQVMLSGEKELYFFSKKGYGLLLLVAFTGAGASLIRLSLVTLYALVPLGLISLFYAFPLFGSGKGLRDLPFIKVFLIALSWAYLTVMIPAAECGFGMGNNEWSLFTERTLFLLAITLPFDIRDLPFDDPAKRTFPQILGVRGAKGLALSLLLLFIVSSIGRLVTTGHELHLMLGYAATTLIAAFLIVKAPTGKAPFYYEGALDGTMLFMFLAVAAFDLIL